MPEADDTEHVASFLSNFAERQSELRNVLRRFRQLCLQKGRQNREFCRSLAEAFGKAEDKGIAVCKLLEAENGSQCPECGKTVATKGAMSSHRHRTHGVDAELSLVSCGSVCQVCMIDHRSSKRLRAHLYNVERCRKAYLGADLGDAGSKVMGGQSAWQPPVRVEGPQPFWTRFMPAFDTSQHDVAVDAQSVLCGMLQSP